MDNSINSVLLQLLNPEIVVFLIPIVGIIAGTIIAILKMVHAHNESIAMIQQGIHPDYPPEIKDET